jgi:tetratricopeptide (TPR) repeat protein
MFGMFKKLFGNDVDLEVVCRTEEDILKELGISKKDFKSSVKDTLDLLLKTQDFDKLYDMIRQLRDIEHNRDNELKRRIAEEVADIIADKHNELIKESTQFKKQGNLDEAINTIYRAIREYPTEDVRQSYFKLAYYYQLQKKWDDSWAIFQKVEEYSNPHNIIEYQINNAELLEERVKHLKREKNTGEYLYFLALSVYADLVMRSMNGARSYTEKFYANIDDDFINPSLLKDEKLKSEYLQLVRVFLESKKDAIFKLIEYTENKTWQGMDKEILKELTKDLDHGGMSRYYNEHMSEKMSVLK